jgi:hypothetical protein
MDPTVNSQMQAAWGYLVQGLQTRAEQDHRVLGGILTRMLIQGGDPANYADLQTGSHVPTPQPYVVPNFVSPSGTVIK